MQLNWRYHECAVELEALRVHFRTRQDRVGFRREAGMSHGGGPRVHFEGIFFCFVFCSCFVSWVRNDFLLKRFIIVLASFYRIAGSTRKPDTWSCRIVVVQ